MKSIHFDNPTMNIQNSYNRFKENHISEEQKTEEFSSKTGSQIIRKKSIPENVNNNPTIKNGSSFIGFDWSTVMDEDTLEMSLKEAILGNSLEDTKNKLSVEKFNQYLKTLDSQSEGLISSGNFDKFV